MHYSGLITITAESEKFPWNNPHNSRRIENPFCASNPDLRT